MQGFLFSHVSYYRYLWTKSQTIQSSRRSRDELSIQFLEFVRRCSFQGGTCSIKVRFKN